MASANDNPPVIVKIETATRPRAIVFSGFEHQAGLSLSVDVRSA
jgi:hypothetical protein